MKFHVILIKTKANNNITPNKQHPAQCSEVEL